MFANILLSGPCNARCPFCIGKLLDPTSNQNNLNIFPLLHLDEFLQTLIDKHITEISLTGTNTDPSLYQYQRELISYIRSRIPQANISLHTNGRLLLQQKDIAALYDRIALSFPSFHEETYHRMMGVDGVPDITSIIKNISRPIKISCIVTSENSQEIDYFVHQCQKLGIKRITFRMLYQDTATWAEYINPQQLGWKKVRIFANNPVYDFHGLEITLRTFESSDITCINLYSNGEISDKYLLTNP